jgi:hypothetical protein
VGTQRILPSPRSERGREDQYMSSEPVRLLPLRYCVLCREEWPAFLAYDHYRGGHQFTLPFEVCMPEVVSAAEVANDAGDNDTEQSESGSGLLGL